MSKLFTITIRSSEGAIIHNAASEQEFSIDVQADVITVFDRQKNLTIFAGGSMYFCAIQTEIQR